MSAKDRIQKKYDWLRMCHAATKNIIRAFPDDKLDWAPAEGARSARDIVQHIYGASVAHSLAVLKGTLTQEDYANEPKAPAGCGAKALAAWTDGPFAQFDADARKATEAQLAATVKAFYGDFSGETILDFSYDEHWHHRGQLTVYLRLLGIPVPFIYDFEEKGA